MFIGPNLFGPAFPTAFRNPADPGSVVVPNNPLMGWGASSFMGPGAYNPYAMYNPMAAYTPYAGASAAMYDTQLGSPGDGVRGAGRAMLGELKMVPGLGNLANGVDFIHDIGQMGRALKGDPTQSVFKKGADLLFHGIGTLFPQIGGAYDIAQGTVRAGAAAMNPFNYGYGLPQFTPNYYGYPTYFPGVMY